MPESGLGDPVSRDGGRSAGGGGGLPARAAGSDVGRVGGSSRGERKRPVAYALATGLGGVSALVILGFTVASGETSLLDVLLWSCLAALMLGSAARRWWFADRAADRSLGVQQEISTAEVARVAASSGGDVETVRRLRMAHPGLGLRDAYELMQAEKQDRLRDSA